MADRPRGCMVQPVEEKDKYGLEAALGTNPNGERFLVNYEGVGYQITVEQEAQLTPKDEGELVDLADWIRVFGDRLEVNFRLWYNRLTEGI